MHEIIINGEKVLPILEKSYGIKIAEAHQIVGSYSKRAWDLQTTGGKSFILKFILDINPSFDLPHHDAEVAFSEFINSHLQNEIKITRFVGNLEGKTLQHIKEDDYFWLLEKDEIIYKQTLSADEQEKLGRLMSSLHTVSRTFQHPGLRTTDYMRNLSDQEISEMTRIFPDLGFEPYLDFMKPLNYEKLGLQLTTLHGDIHQDNISFTKPPILFDLDTLARGSRTEEIARTITHWNLNLDEVKDFYDNLVTGYNTLSDMELELIPKLSIAQLYRKYFEFRDNSDVAEMNKIPDQIAQFKQIFNLPS